VHFCEKVNSKILIRGIRSLSDFEVEFQMSTMNRHLNPKIETLHIMTDEKFFFVSSTLIKEVARYGGSLKGLVPNNVALAIKKKIPEVKRK
jgi:pantetheine-phosphate adenylyltransferase